MWVVKVQPLIIASRALLACVLCASLCAGCALIPLNADPIDSQVVDADTGRPIEGAVVVAYWQLHRGSIGGDALPCGAANVEEAVTDKDGNFHLPGWGPVMGACGDLMEGEPMIYVFKSGYGYGRFANGQGYVETVYTTPNTWKDRQMKLRRFKNKDLRASGLGSYAANFSALSIELSDFIADMPDQCNWKKIPIMLRAIAIQTNEFHESGNNLLGLDGQLIINDLYFQKTAPQCGSPKKFILGLLK